MLTRRDHFYVTIFVDLLKVGLFFKVLSYVEDAHPLKTRSRYMKPHVIAFFYFLFFGSWCLPGAETARSVVPKGSGWRWFCPSSPYSYCGRHLSAGLVPSHPGSLWSNCTDWKKKHIQKRICHIAFNTFRAIPVFILCFSHNIHQDLETIPSHLATLFVEVKGDITEGGGKNKTKTGSE